MMNKDGLFQSVRGHILGSPGYREVSFFPGNIQSLSNIEQLIWWLATTDFSSSQDGLKSALSELVQILYLLDPSHEKVFKVLQWIVNQDTTGLLDAAAQSVVLFLKDNEQEKAKDITRFAVELLIEQQPSSRSYIAAWIIYEFDLGYHPDLPLMELANTIKQNYQEEFGRPLSIDMQMTIGLATGGLGKRDLLNEVVVMALNHTFHNISSLAIVWLAEARAADYDAHLKKTLQKIQLLTLKQIWNGAQFNTFTTNPSKVLLARNTYKESFGDIYPAIGI